MPLAGGYSATVLALDPATNMSAVVPTPHLESTTSMAGGINILLDGETHPHHCGRVISLPSHCPVLAW